MRVREAGVDQAQLFGLPVHGLDELIYETGGVFVGSQVNRKDVLVEILLGLDVLVVHEQAEGLGQQAGGVIARRQHQCIH